MRGFLRWMLPPPILLAAALLPVSAQPQPLGPGPAAAVFPKPAAVSWLPAEVLKAADLPDDPVWRATAESLPGWWAEAPNVTAPAPAPATRAGEFWVAVHVYSAGGECAFAHASGSTLPEAAAAAMRAARRSTAIAGAMAEHAAVFLGAQRIVLDLPSLPVSDWGEPEALGRSGFLSFHAGTRAGVVSPFHALRRNEADFRPDVGYNGPPPDWHVYTGRQFLLGLATDPPSVTEILRGKPLVPAGWGTRAEVEAMASMASGWLLRNVAEDGRLTYRVTLGQNAAGTPHPDGENELRQWMATRALIEAARREKSEAALAIARRNVESNLRRFYRNEDDYGIILMGGQVKLGAAALAALALREFPDAPPDWREKEERLERLVSFLWRNDGSFRTFLRPAARARNHDNENFYSGEALLYWATRLAAGPEESLVNRFHRSTAYYRQWHLRQRNPAFIPWHTMALVTAWPLTRETPGAAWVFEMNDWLLRMQQTEGAAGHPDTAGRFFDPVRSYGPPHASSDGVYLEGLCAALRLARLTGDTVRAQTYARAIHAGLRHARQLQFSGPADWLDLSSLQRAQAEGGFRTTEYNSDIRCDNVQHILQACWAALEFPDDSGVFASGAPAGEGERSSR